MNGRLRNASIGLLLATSVISFPAAAIEFDWGEFEGSFNSQISLGASWRMSEQDPLLVRQAMHRVLVWRLPAPPTTVTSISKTAMFIR